jgi:hypothetical protein
MKGPFDWEHLNERLLESHDPHLNASESAQSRVSGKCKLSRHLKRFKSALTVWGFFTTFTGVSKMLWNKKITRTYHVRFIPEGVVEASIFFRDAHVLSKLFSYEKYCGRNENVWEIGIAEVAGGKPIAVRPQSISDVSAINPLVAFYDIPGRKGEVLFFCSVPDTTRDIKRKSIHSIKNNSHLLSVPMYS